MITDAELEKLIELGETRDSGTWYQFTSALAENFDALVGRLRSAEAKRDDLNRVVHGYPELFKMLENERDALRNIIDNAEHSANCHVHKFPPQFSRDPLLCDCFKSRLPQ